MKVCFDVSILGYSLLRRQYRTGIYRVAVSLLRALARRPGLEVVGYSSSGNLGLCRKALALEGLGHIVVVGSQLRGHLTFGLLITRNLLERKGLRTWAAWFGRWHRLAEVWRFRSDARAFHPGDWVLSPMESPPGPVRDLPGVRVAVVIHDLIPLVLDGYQQNTGDPSKWFPRLIRELQSTDLLFTVSAFTKTDFLRLFPRWSAHQLVVAPNAVEPEMFFPGPRTPGDPFFLTVSTIEPRKRIDTIARAYGLYRAKGGTARLVIVGTNREKHVTRVLDTLPSELRASVQFLGYVEDAALPPLYRSCLGFLFVSEYEGFGLPVLEAMHCGAPVVVSNRTSLPEVVGEAGVQVSPDDHQTLASILDRLERDAEWRAGLCRASLDRARTFSWGTTASIIQTALESLP